MFRFRIGSIPVDVHFSHLLVSAAFGFTFLPQPHPSGQIPPSWPERFLMDADSPERAKVAALYVLAWMIIVFVSVLVHELGHAVAGRAFGYRPAISLVWMGGHTVPNAPGEIPWHKDVLLTFAGPLFGLLLGVGSLALRAWIPHQSEVLDFFLKYFASANLFWAVLNLIPVLPLDGGRITGALAQRFFGRKGFAVAQGLAVVVSSALVAAGVYTGQLILALMFGMFGLRALTSISASLRGEAAGEPEGAHPLHATLRHAREALQQGRLEEAWRLGRLVLEDTQLPPLLESQAHHLLGWVALKEGKGRAALDHFSQAQQVTVEPHALAASFSLIGDEPRAVMLWEMAYRQREEPTILHEYAGSLIRLQRMKEALKLPGVDPVTAYRCAQRVLFIRGAFSEAAALGEEAVERAPHSELAYDAACAYARANDSVHALKMLQRATELGFRDVEYASSDSDLDSLRGQEGFEAWLSALRQS